MAQPRFFLLLVALVLLMLSSAFMAHQGHAASLLTTILFWLILASAVVTIRRRHRTALVALSLGVCAVIVQAMNLVPQQPVLAGVGHVLSIVFLIYIIAIILWFVFETQRVTANLIYASLCVYLLLAVAWALGYSLIELLAPDSFTLPLNSEGQRVFFRFGGERTNLSLYYSLVTLTTLGYGDIVPKSPAAQMLAALEAVAGQVYLAVLVARLVGLHIAHSSIARKND